MIKNYQIYGLGNALVDFEIETTLEELASLGIEKGVIFTLVRWPLMKPAFFIVMI